MGTDSNARGRFRGVTQAAARGLTLFLAGFCLLNAIGGFLRNSFDATIWLFDLRSMSAPWARIAILCLGVVLLLVCILWRRPQMRRIAAASLAPVILISLLDAARFYRLLGQGAFSSDLPLPLSLITALVLLYIAIALTQPAAPRSRPIICVASFIIAAIAFPLLQMYCFGKSDYRRPVDVIVVFGARVYADGRCSDALADRVRTGAALYRDGYAPHLLMTGGPGDGAIHETAAMKQLAMSLGVPEEAILLDPDGLNTDASVRNTTPVFAQIGAPRVIAVSHFYHLPRIKLAYARAGQELYTVPAWETYTLKKMPYMVAREVAALWVYYLRG